MNILRAAGLLIVGALGALGASHPSAAHADEPGPSGAAEEPSVRVQPAAAAPAAPSLPGAAPAASESSPANTPTAPAPASPAPTPPLVPPSATAGASSTTSTPPANRAAPAPSPLDGARFGDLGQLVLDGALSANFGHLGFSAGGSESSLSIQPGFAYFVAQNLSVGASAILRYLDNTPSPGASNTLESKELEYGLTGEIGFNLGVGDHLSFWPNLSLGVWQIRTTYSQTVELPGYGQAGVAPASVTENAVFVELFAPFLVHLTPHFFIGFGPECYVDLYNTASGLSNRRTFIGASSTVGGWF